MVIVIWVGIRKGEEIRCTGDLCGLKNMKNRGEEKGSGGKDGLLWRTKGTYKERRVDPITIST